MLAARRFLVRRLLTVFLTLLMMSGQQSVFLPRKKSLKTKRFIELSGQNAADESSARKYGRPENPSVNFRSIIKKSSNAAGNRLRKRLTECLYTKFNLFVLSTDFAEIARKKLKRPLFRLNCSALELNR